MSEYTFSRKQKSISIKQKVNLIITCLEVLSKRCKFLKCKKIKDKDIMKIITIITVPKMLFKSKCTDEEVASSSIHVHSITRTHIHTYISTYVRTCVRVWCVCGKYFHPSRPTIIQHSHTKKKIMPMIRE